MPTFPSTANYFQRSFSPGEADRVIDLLLAWQKAEGKVSTLSGAAAFPFAISLAGQQLQAGEKVSFRVPPDFSGERALRRSISQHSIPLPPPSNRLRTALLELASWRRSGTEKIYGDRSLPDLVGWLITREEPGRRERVSRQINPGELAFTEDELFAFREQIRITQKLYPGIARLPEVLSELNVGIFRHQTMEDSREFIQDRLSTFIEQTEELLGAYLLHGNAYYRHRHQSFREMYQVLLVQLSALERQGAIIQEEMGPDGSGKIPGRLVAGLSRKHKEYRLRIGEFYEQLTPFIKSHQQKRPFAFSWPEYPEELPLSEWQALLSRYREKLQEWYDQHRPTLREEYLALSPQTANQSIRGPGSSTALRQLARQLEQLTQYINDSGLFQRPVSTTAGTTARQQKALEQLLDRLQQVSGSMTDYPAFYRWQKNWFSLPAQLRRLITPLLHFPQDDWEAAFTDWYFNRALEDRPVPDVAPPTVEQLNHLFIDLATARAANKPQPFPAKALRFIAEGDAIPADTDLLIDLGRNAPEEAEATNRLIVRVDLAATTKGGAHLLPIANHYHPSLAFFQDWHSQQLPDWQAHDLSQEDWAMDKLISLLSPFPADFTIPDDHWQAERPLLLLWDENTDIQCTWLADFRYNYRQATQAIVLLPEVDAVTEDIAAALLELMRTTRTLRLAHRISQKELNAALLSDGVTSRFIVAALIRATEAIAEDDVQGFRAMASEHRTRLGYTSPGRQQFLEALLPRLKKRLPDHRFSLHQAWRDTFLPLVITSPNGKRNLILTEAMLPGTEDTYPLLDRLQSIVAAGYQLHFLTASDYLERGNDPVEELSRRLLVQS